MNTLRPVCLLLAGFSLLVVLACGMTLYALQIGEPSVQFRQVSSQEFAKSISEARDASAVRDICLPLAHAYNAQSSMVQELSSFRCIGLMAALCWGALSAIVFAWVFAVLRNAERVA